MPAFSDKKSLPKSAPRRGKGKFACSWGGQTIRREAGSGKRETGSHYSHSIVTRCGMRVEPFPVAGELRCEPFCPPSMDLQAGICLCHHASRMVLRQSPGTGNCATATSQRVTVECE